MGEGGALTHESVAVKVKFPTVNLASSARRKEMDRAQKMAMNFMRGSKDEVLGCATFFIQQLL